MFWLIGGAIAAVGILGFLSYEENQAYSRYKSTESDLFKETEQREQQMQAQRTQHAYARNFREHIELHYASVQTANALYQHYEAHKNMVKMFRAKQKSLGAHIGMLKAQRDRATGEDKQAIKIELQQYYEYLKQAKAQLVSLYAAKDDLLNKIRKINQQTRAYKLYIRDHCGTQGHDWYARRLERSAIAAR